MQLQNVFTDCKYLCWVPKEHHYKHVSITITILIDSEIFCWLPKEHHYKHAMITITKCFHRLRNLLLSTWEKVAPSVAREECPPPWTSPASSGTFRTRGPLFNKFWSPVKSHFFQFNWHFHDVLSLKYYLKETQRL